MNNNDDVGIFRIVSVSMIYEPRLSLKILDKTHVKPKNSNGPRK